MRFIMSLGAAICMSFSLQAFDFKGNEKVLDIACGPGKNAFEIARKLDEGLVIGIDFSNTIIHEAKRKNLQGPSNLRFKLEDLNNLNYKEEFDVVTCYSPRQFLFDQDKLLISMHHLLKPNGHIHVMIPTKVPVALESALRAITTSEDWSDHFLTFHPTWNLFDQDKYSDLLRKHQFSIIETHSVPSEEIFASKEAFIEFIKGWLPYYEALADDLQQSFIEQLTDKYLSIMPLDSEGKVHFFVEKLEVVAKKNQPEEKKSETLQNS